MANFKTSMNGTDISSFDVPLGRTLKLVQWGGDGARNRLDVTLNASTPVLDLKVLPDKLPAASTAFTVTGKASGGPVPVSAYVAASGRTQKYSGDLAVSVKGAPRKQPGYDVDLLSNLALTGDTDHVHAYTRIITGPCNNTHILSQNTTQGHFNCGDVAAGYGERFFSKPAKTSYYVYYEKPTSDQMADLRFNAKRVQQGIASIKLSVGGGTPVRVWLIHHDGFKPQIQGDWRTHFLTIIGYSGTKLLYLDPWPGGSKLGYDGGMYPKTTVCFIGELIFDETDLSKGIGSPPGAAGAHTYKVIAGP